MTTTDDLRRMHATDRALDALSDLRHHLRRLTLAMEGGAELDGMGEDWLAEAAAMLANVQRMARDDR